MRQCLSVCQIHKHMCECAISGTLFIYICESRWMQNITFREFWNTHSNSSCPSWITRVTWTYSLSAQVVIFIVLFYCDRLTLTHTGKKKNKINPELTHSFGLEHFQQLFNAFIACIQCLLLCFYSEFEFLYRTNNIRSKKEEEEGKKIIEKATTTTEQWDTHNTRSECVCE